MFICGWFCLVVGCYRFANPGPPVDAQTAPKETWSRLAGLESFRFQLRFHTDTPFALGAEFRGIWHQPDHESWSGVWRRGDKLERVEFRALGGNQYERTGDGWRRTARGVETRIFEQVQQVLQGKEMTLQDSAQGKYRFRFEPWLPVLDPARQKKLYGELEVDRGSGLPVRVHAQDSASTVDWETRFDRFNRAGDVAAPFVAEQELVIAPERRLSRSGLGQAVAVLRRRLEQADREYRLVRRCGRLVLALGLKASPGILELLLSRGRVELWTATRAAASDTAGLTVGDDASFKVVLQSLVAANGQYEVKAEVEPLPEPRLRFALERVSPAAGDTLLALVLDGRVLDCSRNAEGSRVLFVGWGNKESALMLAALASNPAIDAGFRVLSSR